jgi:hypothetical protein
MTEAERERAAIVEWLRETADAHFNSAEQLSAHPHHTTMADLHYQQGRRYNSVAERIERLDHHKEDSKHG